jgi:hypothetical protein
MWARPEDAEYEQYRESCSSLLHPAGNVTVKHSAGNDLSPDADVEAAEGSVVAVGGDSTDALHPVSKSATAAVLR